MSALASRVVLVVRGDIAGAAGVAGQGIRSGLADSVGETLERLIDPSYDIWSRQLGYRADGDGGEPRAGPETD